MCIRDSLKKARDAVLKEVVREDVSDNSDDEESEMASEIKSRASIVAKGDRKKSIRKSMRKSVRKSMRKSIFNVGKQMQRMSLLKIKEQITKPVQGQLLLNAPEGEGNPPGTLLNELTNSPLKSNKRKSMNPSGKSRKSAVGKATTKQRKTVHGVSDSEARSEPLSLQPLKFDFQKPAERIEFADSPVKSPASPSENSSPSTPRSNLIDMDAGVTEREGDSPIKLMGVNSSYSKAQLLHQRNEAEYGNTQTYYREQMRSRKSNALILTHLMTSLD
eukprot:TRINITY_DN13135_c0_g1_i4.p1 TRINITY_DN13135_c0_g1~~TRINITY_DN13135_c0_g1_i4.p1  ORF type:complete len:275 (+),score=39.20 TRINITY_DN13135_c0_g1_i4:65-889(+)